MLQNTRIGMLQVDDASKCCKMAIHLRDFYGTVTHLNVASERHKNSAEGRRGKIYPGGCLRQLPQHAGWDWR